MVATRRTSDAASGPIMKPSTLLPLFALLVSAAAAAGDPVRDTDALLRSHHYSGVVRVSKGDDVLFHRAYGKSSIETATDVRLDTPFRIASISKLFTAVAIARLAEQGRIDHDATIHAYLPDYAGDGGAVVTVRQLLTHTSGIANSDAVETFEQAVAEGMPLYQLPATSQQIVQRYASGRLVHPPGTHFDYNNADYFILGRIIEQITGEAYASALKHLVLDPVGLDATGMMDWRSLAPVVAAGYLRVGPGAPYIRELPVYHENWGAAGGLYSTSEDLARFSDALFAGRIVGAESLARLLTVDRDEYAHGLWVAPIAVRGRPDRVAHRPGQIMGANTTLLRYIDDGLTVIMLSNTDITPMDDTAFEIARKFSQHDLGD
jgi:D-alanyl-D-alanine carboxypeptidase